MKNLASLLFSFKGRVDRTTFSIFVICWFILFTLVNYLANSGVNADGTPHSGLSIIASIFLLATFWPLFAVEVKRWHDRNKSGWWCLIGLVPLIGGFWVLIECCFLPAVDEGNRF